MSRFKMSVLVLFFLTMFVVVGCGPDYPNDENHQDVSNSDCIACHVDRDHPDAEKLPGDHFKDGDLKSRREDCKKCHEQE